MEALVQVLRLVDNEKEQAIGSTCETVEKAKESIAKSFNGNTISTFNIFEIIGKRWECQLHHALHATWHYFNPQFFYNDSNIAKKKDVTNRLYKYIERLSIDVQANDQSSN